MAVPLVTALGRVVVGERGILGDAQAWHGHAGGIGQRQISLGGEGLGGADLDLTGTALGMKQQRLLVGGAAVRLDHERGLPQFLSLMIKACMKNG